MNREPAIADELQVNELIRLTSSSSLGLDREFSVLVQFLLATGARPPEATKLCWATYHADHRYFVLTGKNTKKTGRLRRLFIGRQTEAILQSLGPRSGMVFYRWRSSHPIKRRFEETCRKYNLPVIYPYSICRPAITKLFRELSVSDVEKLVDSSSQTIVNHYDAQVLMYLPEIADRTEKI